MDKMIDLLLEGFSEETKQAFKDSVAVMAFSLGLTIGEVLDNEDLTREAWLEMGLLMGV